MAKTKRVQVWASDGEGPWNFVENIPPKDIWVCSHCKCAHNSDARKCQSHSCGGTEGKVIFYENWKPPDWGL